MMTKTDSARSLPSATLETERQFFDSGVELIAGMDEVGRGALAGPVYVGAALVPSDAKLSISGLIDSKALSQKKRLAMKPEIHDWCVVEVGSASAEEIDALGMTRSLRLAGQRALAQATARSSSPDMVLLDGKHDWLTPAEADLFENIDEAQLLYQRLVSEAWGERPQWHGPVHTVIKGDYTCASIAAASVVAKVDRDQLMDELHALYPEYGWAKNKGYGSAAHRQSIAEQGPSPLHRLSWNLGATSSQIRDAYLQRVAKGEQR